MADNYADASFDAQKLTVNNLMAILSENGVSLPTVRQKKDFYINLFKKEIQSLPTEPSNKENVPMTPGSGKKTPSKLPVKKVLSEETPTHHAYHEPTHQLAKFSSIDADSELSDEDSIVETKSVEMQTDEQEIEDIQPLIGEETDIEPVIREETLVAELENEMIQSSSLSRNTFLLLLAGLLLFPIVLYSEVYLVDGFMSLKYCGGSQKVSNSFFSQLIPQCVSCPKNAECEGTQVRCTVPGQEVVGGFLARTFGFEHADKLLYPINLPFCSPTVTQPIISLKDIRRRARERALRNRLAVENFAVNSQLDDFVGRMVEAVVHSSIPQLIQRAFDWYIQSIVSVIVVIVSSLVVLYKLFKRLSKYFMSPVQAFEHAKSLEPKQGIHYLTKVFAILDTDTQKDIYDHFVQSIEKAFE